MEGFFFCEIEIRKDILTTSKMTSYLNFFYFALVSSSAQSQFKTIENIFSFFFFFFVFPPFYFQANERQQHTAKMRKEKFKINLSRLMVICLDN